MKNRLIYSLIMMMSVSLLGIIGIQARWISQAVQQQQKEFNVHVNDALNRLNTAILEDEAAFMIDDKFGGIDSLIDQIFIKDNENGAGSKTIVTHQNPHDTNQKIEINYEIGDKEKRIVVNRSSAHKMRAHWTEKLEFDSSTEQEHFELAEKSGVDTLKLRKMSRLVKQFGFEKSLTGNLKDRIAKKELKIKATRALRQEGINEPFQFAVQNKMDKSFEKDFVSSGFDTTANKATFRKRLFPGDRIQARQYDLLMQFDNNSAHIWKGISGLALLSALFTVLILASFGYALYFIFKQKKISQVKNDFINNMTHELKTPLATISLATSSINHPEVLRDGKEVMKLTAIIDKERNRMNAHIERVLEIAALEKGELYLQNKAVDLAELVKDCTGIYDLTLAKNNAAIQLSLPTGECYLTGDEYHLSNALNNLLDNSLKYKSEDALLIEVRLVKTDQNIVLSVTDNGMGMDRHSQNMAFDKFYRAQGGDLHNKKGFGLGLSYVKSIVEAHNGSVLIQSDLGKGTEIILKFKLK